MFLGLLAAGMGVGALAAGVWIASGGSVLIGFVIYSLVATMFILGKAVVSHIVSEWREACETGKAEALYPAE